MGGTEQNALRLLNFYPQDIGRAWLASLEAVEAENKAVGRLPLLWTCLDCEDVWYGLLQPVCQLSDCPEWLLEILAHEGGFLSAMKMLLRRSLIQKNENGSFSLHPVVQKWISCVRQRPGEVAVCRRMSLFAVARAVPPSTEPKFWVLQKRLLPHAEKCRQWLMREDSLCVVQDAAFVSAITALGDLFSHQGRLLAAESLYLRALSAVSGESIETDILILGIRRTLAVVLHRQNRILEAQKTFLEVLRGCEWVGQAKMVPCCTRYVRQLEADTRNDYANLCIDQEELGEVESLLGKALGTKKELLGMDHPSTLNTVNDLATLYVCQGHWDDAEDQFRLALHGQTRVLGPGHTFTLNTVNNLGLLYADRGQLREGIALCRTALEGYENALGRDHYLTIHIARNVGSLLAHQGLPIEAATMYRRAQDGYRKVFGKRHPLYRRTTRELDSLLRRVDAAETTASLVSGGLVVSSAAAVGANEECFASSGIRENAAMSARAPRRKTMLTPSSQDDGGVKLEPE
jgi:tetratricopeptide (TPR) repeat protein